MVTRMMRGIQGRRKDRTARTLDQIRNGVADDTGTKWKGLQHLLATGPVKSSGSRRKGDPKHYERGSVLQPAVRQETRWNPRNPQNHLPSPPSRKSRRNSSEGR